MSARVLYHTDASNTIIYMSQEAQTVPAKATFHWWVPFGTIIVFNHKRFPVCRRMRKVWRADLVDPEPKVERRNTACQLPFGESSMRHYLVESLRHVHLVLADEHNARVALFRLDWDKKMWMQDRVRGDRVLLLGRGCSASVPAASGRPPGMLLFAHQPSLSLVDVGGCGAGLAWFWAESWVDDGSDDMLVLKKKMHHRQGEFTAES
uniref:KIB1-4 beta-propeller domain-containing protein n=1 Tax=Aegilops tauschii TaxID=37682 RepID=M8C8N4_AEGTA